MVKRKTAAADYHDANWVNTDYDDLEFEEDFIDETPRGKEDVPQHIPKKRKQTDQAGLKRNPARRGEGKGTARCWEGFVPEWIEEEDGVERKWAECIFCLKLLKADTDRNGTGSLNKHWRSCKANPDNKKEDDKNQATLNIKKEPNNDGNVSLWKHDEARIKRATLGLFTVGELPFKFIEHEAFIEYTNALNGRVILPSRHKISRDVAKFYLDERMKLFKYLSNPNTATHLTTDTWTSSCQKINYMAITAHFIDDDWVMHKRIINFREINTHKGEEMGMELLACIHEWGMKNVMTMTVDNAKTNDVAIETLVKKLPMVYDNGKQFHIRCMAHIINLIVKVGLKYQNYHVECVQKAVKYIRGSTQRIKKFKKAMRDVGMESKKFLCGESPTRWNSTFELLKSAYDAREAFVEFGIKEKSYEKDLDRVPEHSDFREIKKMIDFLEKFKTKTENVSASTRPLVHLYTREILDVELHISRWDTEVGLVHMIAEMKEKYDKYWGDYEKMSDFVFFAVLLDPTCKSKFLLYTFEQMIGYKTKEGELLDSDKELQALKMLREIERKIGTVFKTYSENYNKTVPSQETFAEEVVDCDDDNDFFGNYLSTGGTNSNATDNLYHMHCEVFQHF